MDKKEQMKDDLDSMSYVVGKDDDGNKVYSSFLKAPHLLVSGATGSGRDSFIFTLLKDLINNNNKEQLNLYIINRFPDEITNYVNINSPQVMSNKVFAEPQEVNDVLEKINDEMLERYAKFSEKNVTKISAYNELSKNKIPRIIVFFHEYEDYINGPFKEQFQDNLLNILRMGRASGIHVVLATQRILRAITDDININVPPRIAFHMTSDESKLFLGNEDAEKLINLKELIYENDYNDDIYMKLSVLYE